MLICKKFFFQHAPSISATISGLEPEAVIVIEIADNVDKFRQAVDATEGLDWLGEWDIEDVMPDKDFYYEVSKIGVDFLKVRLKE